MVIPLMYIYYGLDVDVFYDLYKKKKTYLRFLKFLRGTEKI